RSAGFYLGRHISKIRIQTGSETEASAANRSNERARFIQRQSCDVAAEVVPDAVLLKVLLYIGEIEGRDHAVFRFDICSDTTNRFGTGKVTDDGHYQILRVEGFQDTKIFFARQITAGNAVSISGDHQFSITDAVTEASPATRAIVDIGTE